MCECGTLLAALKRFIFPSHTLLPSIKHMLRSARPIDLAQPIEKERKVSADPGVRSTSGTRLRLKKEKIT